MGSEIAKMPWAEVQTHVEKVFDEAANGKDKIGKDELAMILASQDGAHGFLVHDHLTDGDLLSKEQWVAHMKAVHDKHVVLHPAKADHILHMMMNIYHHHIEID